MILLTIPFGGWLAIALIVIFIFVFPRLQYVDELKKSNGNDNDTKASRINYDQETPEEKIRKELENAVRADDVQQVYEMLKCGINDINFYVCYNVTEYDHSIPYETTVTSCLMDIARSEPMKRLLRHYGALSLQEIKEIQKNEEAEKSRQRARRYAEKQKKEEEILKQKAEADNRFLDSVLS